MSTEAAGMSGWYALPTLPLAVEAASPSAEDTERALGLVDMIRQAPTRLGKADVLEAVTMAVLADLRRQPAEPAWADAVRAFGAPGVEGPAYWHAYALYRWARALVDAGGERAPAVLEQAADAASALRTDPLLARLTTLARRAHLPVPAACSTRVTHAADQASLTEREVRSSRCWPRDRPTPRSPSDCSSAPRQRASTSPTSCASSTPAPAPRRSRSLDGRDWWGEG